MAFSRLIAIWVVLATILLLRFLFSFTAHAPYKAGDTISVRARVQSEPTLKGNVQGFEVRYKGFIIHVWTSRFPRYHYGDHLKISGTVEKLGDSRWHFSMYFPAIEPQGQGRQLFLAVIERIRQQVVSTIRQVLPGNSASLLTGILFGSKEAFSERFIEGLRNTGTLHVVAASGMNVSILASFVMAIFLRFFRRRVAALFVVIAIFFYASLAFFQPAIVRASIMGIALFVASILNRGAQAAMLLLLAGYSMLLFDPLLIFDVGFQLSFVATAGLLFLLPLFGKTSQRFQRVKSIPLLGEGVTTTIVAQAATLPILLTNFGAISAVSVLVNGLILWTVPTIMLLGIIAGLLSFLPILSYPILLATLPLLVLFERIVVLFDNPQFLVAIQVPFLVALGYYCVLVGLYFFLKRRDT